MLATATASVMLFGNAAPIWAGSTTAGSDEYYTDLSVYKGTVGGIPVPKAMLNEGVPTKPGTWLLGATPESVDINKPPIVFVQGLHCTAREWWADTTYYGHNDMYERAYKAGYRTAFVQLYDAAGANQAANNWDNGAMLADLLKKIYDHFGEKVNIVAHSKGGIDTQTAIVYNNAHSYVNEVVTLSSPLHGSNLADLVYSTEAGWLAKLLGKRDAGTESLQTGNMKRFREITDKNENVYKNTYYTAGGNNWGPSLKALWFGGAYLSQYGDNDGLVNVWSTRLPYGKELFVDNLDHDAIHHGSKVFNKIEPVLRSTEKVPDLALTKKALLATPDVQKIIEKPVEQVVAGGALTANKEIEKSIYVDSNVKQSVFNILTKEKNTNVTLISPSNKVYNKKSTEFIFSQMQDFLQGAYSKGFFIDNPEKGEWKIKIVSSSTDAYFMFTNFIGSSTVSIDVDQTVKTNQDIPLKVKIMDLEQLDMNSVDVQVKTITMSNQETIQQQGIKQENGTFINRIQTPSQADNLNVTIAIKGKTKDGEAFERTEIQTINVSK